MSRLWPAIPGRWNCGRSSGRISGGWLCWRLYAYDPQAIVFGGSISHAFGFFRDAMYEQLKQFPYAKTVEGLHICCSGIEYVGLLGASACE